MATQQEAAYEKYSDNHNDYMSADSQEDFGAGYQAGLEAAAKVCDERASKDAVDDPREYAAQLCAEEIRDIKNA